MWQLCEISIIFTYFLLTEKKFFQLNIANRTQFQCNKGSGLFAKQLLPSNTTQYKTS